MNDLHAFIPAAGLGERMRPLTDFIPKPLLPLLGAPLIEEVAARVASAVAGSICINLHHKSEMVRDWAEASAFRDRIALIHEEPDILGTGGALKNAEHLLRDRDFLVHNSDIVSDIDLQQLIDAHCSSKSLATLAVHDYPAFNNVWLDEEGCVISVGERPAANMNCRPAAFMGIAVYSPGLFEFLPQGRSHVVDGWLRAAAQGHRIRTLDFSGSKWRDIGNPDSYAAEIFSRLSAEGETVHMNPVPGWGSFRIEGRVVVEKGCRIHENAFLKDCVLLPGSEIMAGEAVENAVVAAQGHSARIHPAKVFAQEEEPRELSASVLACFGSRPAARLIGVGGSDRRYFRLDDGSKTLVLMQCRPGDPDFERHLALTAFFRALHIPVPVPFAQHAGACEALFSDLGDLTLYSWMKCGRSGNDVRDICLRVVEILARIHAAPRSDADIPLPSVRMFDYEHLRWESGYFLERFVKGVRGISPSSPEALEKELHLLAQRVDALPKTVMHRDFQSQNIMVTHDSLPWVIDFQGCRIGPPEYDLASMLWDPYLVLPGDLRRECIDAYAAHRGVDAGTIHEGLLPCRLQRHMQALGAYGFLSRVKGKPYFMKYVPAALKYLAEETRSASQDYPALHALVQQLA